MSDSTLSWTKKSEQDEFRELSPDELGALSAEEAAEYVQQSMIRSLKRYGGKPERLLKDHVRRDFSVSERPHKHKKLA